jgi:3-deoxy-D-manno-octulosonate 8-phosphate phosphatase (KDO 8-P phosphatase)
MDIQAEILNRAKKVKLLILDVDGVMTNGQLIIGNELEEFKVFDVKDGLGMRLLQKTGIELAIITGKQSNIVYRRAEELDVKFVYQGQPNKVPAFMDLLNKLKLEPEHVGYLGDDLPDLPLLKKVGFAAVVADAVPYVVSHAHYQTRARGGKGAVREICELIMHAQGNLHTVQESFLVDGSILHSAKEAG